MIYRIRATSTEYETEITKPHKDAYLDERVDISKIRYGKDSPYVEGRIYGEHHQTWVDIDGEEVLINHCWLINIDNLEEFIKNSEDIIMIGWFKDLDLFVDEDKRSDIPLIEIYDSWKE